VLTGYGTIGTAVEAIRLGAINYLTKRPTRMRSRRRSKESLPPAMDDVPSLDRQEWEYLKPHPGRLQRQHLRSGACGWKMQPAHAATGSSRSTTPKI